MNIKSAVRGSFTFDIISFTQLDYQLNQESDLRSIEMIPDKGNGFVILYRKLYNNAIEEIISDTSKFEKLNKDPTLKHEASLRLLPKLKQKNFFNKIEYDQLYPFGSTPARIYDGTPKMHKFSSSDSFPKLRPIVSSVGTFNYNLACFFCDLLMITLAKKPFFSQIKNANISKKSLVSYDVASLFTNISLQETIDIAKISFSILILI